MLFYLYSAIKICQWQMEKRMLTCCKERILFHVCERWTVNILVDKHLMAADMKLPSKIQRISRRIKGWGSPLTNR